MNKQIEEMARTICPNIYGHYGCDSCDLYDNECCLPFNIARSLTDKGYRKQEWVSVDESLPENKGDYMVFTKNGNIKVMPFFTERNASAAVYGRGFCEWTKGARTNDDDWWKPVGYITHWMPLPEPPKIKGGE